MKFISIYPILLALLFLFSCKDDDEVIVVPPAPIETNADTYVFARGGLSSVDNSNQVDLARMLDEMIGFADLGNSGEIIEAGVFRAAFENTGDDGGGLFDFESSAQLESLLYPFDLDEDYFGDIFEQAAIASKSGNQAADAMPGLITRSSTGNDILVNNLGQGIDQFIEKGIMGSVFLYQMFNIMLSDNLVGDEVDNINLVAGQNFTELEQNWDKAFGYFHAPGDFGSNWPASRIEDLRYWSHYAQVVDPSLGISDRIMDALRAGRLAIVENDMPTKNESRAIIIRELELLTAACCAHFINKSLIHYDAQENGDLLYNLSSAYMFGRGLLMNPNRAIFPSELHNLLNVDLGLGGNFWRFQEGGLENAKAKLVKFYPILEDVIDEL